MSSLYVRKQIETWLKDSAMAVPFYNTINEDQSPTDNIWCTADFDISSRELLTLCQDYIEESGEVEVVYFGQPGTGYEDLLTAAESDMQTLMSFRDASNKLILINRSAPMEFTRGDADQEYGIIFDVEYQYYP